MRLLLRGRRRRPTVTAKWIWVYARTAQGAPSRNCSSAASVLRIFEGIAADFDTLGVPRCAIVEGSARCAVISRTAFDHLAPHCRVTSREPTKYAPEPFSRGRSARRFDLVPIALLVCWLLIPGTGSMPTAPCLLTSLGFIVASSGLRNSLRPVVPSPRCMHGRLCSVAFVGQVVRRARA